MIWDSVGFVLLIWDAFTLPIMLAWDVDITSPEASGSTGSLLLAVFTWMAIVFWSMDVVLNFNTGFYDKGLRIMKRSLICYDYI